MIKKHRGLLIEDDSLVGEEILRFLEQKYDCQWVQSVDEALAAIGTFRPDFIVSDYLLNGESSVRVLQYLEDKKTPIPFITISGQVDKGAAITFLNAGAQFLLEKPFAMESLEELINKILAKKIDQVLKNVSLGISLDSKKNLVLLQGVPVDLTRTEFRILQILLSHSGENLSKEEMESQVWGKEKISRNLIFTHMGNLRKKIPILDQLVIAKGGFFSIRVAS